MTQKRNCIVAFSLAEVLIAMTIIGVVAMLVIPGLRKYTSQHAFVTQLKKSYTTLNQSLDFAFADDIAGTNAVAKAIFIASGKLVNVSTFPASCP